jgi:ribonucleotide reductase alpha subunit
MVYKYEEVLQSTLDYFQGDKLATDAWIKKYALKNELGEFVERTPDDMHRRLSRKFAQAEARYSNPLSEEEIYGFFKNFSKIVPQGSPMSAVGNDYRYQSLSNCFVIESPYDSYGGIMKTDEEQAQIMKRRGGVGFDISTIRPKGMPTANAAGTTDGIGVFMQRYSNTTKEVAQGGRRGALMIVCSVHHPEIETFITIKRDLNLVTSANVSIKLSDEFMQAVKDGCDYEQRFPVQKNAKHTVKRMVNARELWNKIIASAHSVGDPGLLFWDRIVEQSPADAYADLGFETLATNPCIVGSTLIAVADGRNAVSIQQLVEENKDVPVYSTNTHTGAVEIKMGRNPRKTGENVEVWKLTLDDGSTLIATPNHKILCRDLTYRLLRDLLPGDSIFPFNSFNSNGYRQICNVGAQMSGGARRNRRQYRLIYEYARGELPNAKTHDIHHVDFDGLNDNIDNLRLMLREEHIRLHADKMTGKNNPYYLMTNEWKVKFARHSGKMNGRYSGVTNEELLCYAQKLFERDGRITKRTWQKFAKENNISAFVNGDFRFGSWNNFVNQVASNHKVVSIERCGEQDVYNITVDDNHNYHVITSYADEKFVVSSGICVKNCGELPLCAQDSCRLLLQNLYTCVIDPFTADAKFDWDEFKRVTQVAQRLSDDLVDLEMEAIDRILSKINADPEPEGVKRRERDLWIAIKAKTAQGRRTGLGITGLGDCLAALGIKYGSKKSIKMTDEIYRTLAIESYRASCVLAKERGTFPVFDRTREINHPYLTKVLEQDKELLALYNEHGRRNISNLTTSPAGTVSILTKTTNGIEGGMFFDTVRRRKLNADDTMSPVDFVDEHGERWQEYTYTHPKFNTWMEITGKTDQKESPYWNAMCNDVDWVASIELLAAAQKWVDHSISKTVNLPADVSPDVVNQCYMKAWESGCKGCTVYRAGSKGDIISDASKKTTSTTIQPTTIIESHAPKRPTMLLCHVHKCSVKGEAWTIIVGLFEDKPYEIFGGLSKYVEIPRKVKNGRLKKNGKKDGVATYNLEFGDDDDPSIIKDIVDTFDNPTAGAFTRTLSLSLRHGIPVQYIVEQLQKDKHSDITSFSRVIARVLKDYIPNGTISNGSLRDCPECHAKLVYVGGCVNCSSCSWTLCS